MKGYVITMVSLPESVQSAERCIKSAARFNFEVEMTPAVVPQDDPEFWCEKKGIPISLFREVYSRFENCLSAFCSHYMLWQQSYSEDETLLVLEHDAYFVGEIPSVPFDDILSYGHPSYGKWVTPNTIGKSKLVSKQYLPGAHAYAVTPSGAKKLMDKAKECASPTDLFISNRNFPNCVEEYYPWPVEARDNFSTIQNTRGCVAKHNFNETYRIL